MSAANFPRPASIDGPSGLKIVGEQRAAEARVVEEHHSRYNAFLSVCAGPEIKMLVEMANDMEAHGDTSRIDFLRDGNRRVIGFSLFGHITSLTAEEEAEAMRAEQDGGR